MKFSSIFLKLQLRRLKFPIKLISADILSQDFVLSWWISSNKTTSFFVFWMHSWNFCKLLILSRNKFFFQETQDWLDVILKKKTQKKHIMRLPNLSKKWELNVLLILLCPILLLLCFLLQSPSNYLSVSVVFHKISLWNHDWSIEPCYSTRW